MVAANHFIEAGQRKLGARLLKSMFDLTLHPFNGLLSRTTLVIRHQKSKLFWILMKQKMMGWQWHQLNHMQIICTLLQTDNHASTSPLSFYKPDAFPAAQLTVSKYGQLKWVS